MALRRLTSGACLLLTGGLTLLSFLAPTLHAQAPRRVRAIIDGVPDTGQYLPDTAILARVNDRMIRVEDYIRSYFSSWAPDRPNSDSAGRVQFLNTMINKEVLGFLVREINRPLGFEERAILREHRQRVLLNVLHQRAVIDSVFVPEEDVGRAYKQSGYEQHLRRMVFDNRSTAEEIRRELVAGRLGWAAAFARSSSARSDSAAGDLGWKSREALDPILAGRVSGLRPGEISQVVATRQGYELIQVIARRPVARMPLDVLRRLLMEQLRKEQIAERMTRLRRVWLDQMGVVHDSANIAWAAARIPESTPIRSGSSGPVLDLSGTLPEFAPEDTSRVLARFRGGHLTLGQFLHLYQHIDVIRRPSLHRPFLFEDQLDAFVLEQHMAQIAVERGLESDPLAVAMIEQQRERILVEHLYQDSIESRVWVRPEERRKYYEAHLADYWTYPTVRYAWFLRRTRAQADSIARLLRGGARAEDLVREDSLRGTRGSAIETRSQNEHEPYQKLLFEELKPGQLAVEGPDREGQHLVLQVLSHDPGHQLSYQEAEAYVDESVRSIAAEAVFEDFLARHRRRFRIEAHPDWVMRIRLVDSSVW